MRDALRHKLREISNSLSTAKNGVTGVTGIEASPHRPALHQALHLRLFEKAYTCQRCNTVTPVTPPKTEGQEICNTGSGDTAGVTDRSEVGLQADIAPGCGPEDWLAYYDERAGIREFDGGLSRGEAERLALADTVALLGPQPKGGTR